MRLTAKGEYGMRAVLNLARRNSDVPVSVKRIAREEGVSSGRCKREAVCSLAPVWHDFYAVMNDHLSKVRLDDVVRRRPRPVRAAC